ncbi:MAG TPA: type VI secretion system baseplate subunit TssK [Terrimicrobiaceae bacterium]
MATQIHWHEGLFLQPHHLQRSQRALNDTISAERRLSWTFAYGLVDARLNSDDLENMRLRFDRLRAIMPSGIEITYPGDSELPSIDIKQALATSGGVLNVFLGVPIWFDARANAVKAGQEADMRAKVLYCVNEVDCVDENTGENSKPILMRKINARLVLEGEDPSDLEVIPLVRVIRSAGQDVGMPRQDPEFCGPCLVLGGSALLVELVRDLASQVEASRKELVVQITRAGFSLDNLRGIQFEQIMRLRTLNRFAARLPSLAEAPNVAPFFMYLELRELLGELTALHPDRDAFDVAAYDHDSPYLAFGELSAKIRSLLRGTVAPMFIKIPFANVAEVRTATFEEKHFTMPNDYFLGIETKEDPRALAKLVENPDEFKLMPKSMGTRAIRGVLLKEERFVPLELPAKSGLHYFRLLRSDSGRAWGQIQAEKAAVVRWPDEGSSEFQISLYMTLPAGSNQR